MKIILSRKGFDAGIGGCPSPIFPDGTLLSLPIPEYDLKICKYKDIYYEHEGHKYTYEKIIQSLKPKFAVEYCHLDPDIRKGIRIDSVWDAAYGQSVWKPAFGQAGSGGLGAQSRLEKNGIGLGDLFLFFGLFVNVDYPSPNCRLRWNKNDPVHVIYGYMQIGDVAKSYEEPDKYKYFQEEVYKWHPHSLVTPTAKNMDTFYIPSEHLIFDGVETEFPGCGTLCYNENRVLTNTRYDKWYIWKWLDWMKICNGKINLDTKFYNSNFDFEEGNYFAWRKREKHSVTLNRWQEGVILDDENSAVKWAKKIIGVE
jgi:hypothetical protein